MQMILILFEKLGNTLIANKMTKGLLIFSLKTLEMVVIKNFIIILICEIKKSGVWFPSVKVTITISTLYSSIKILLIKTGIILLAMKFL